MSFYNGETKAYAVTIKDTSGNPISTDDILDIQVRLFSEYNNADWLIYKPGGGSGIYRTLSTKVDKTGYEFEIEASDSSSAKYGRYIAEVTYKTYDTRFDNNEKITKARGPLITISK